MTKIKTAELTGAALDWAVGKASGIDCWIGPSGGYEQVKQIVWTFSTEVYDNVAWEPSLDPAQAWPIIEREEIHPFTQYPRQGTKVWYARVNGRTLGTGPTSLVAAMRCYVASVKGDEVDIPDELLED